MATKLAPTRGNLVKLTRSMEMAQSGHDLLDQKRQVLMMELVRFIDSAKTIQEDVEMIFHNAYEALQKANISLGIDTVEDISESVPITSDIVVRLHSVMGVEIPDVDPLSDETIPSYSLTRRFPPKRGRAASTRPTTSMAASSTAPRPRRTATTPFCCTSSRA